PACAPIVAIGVVAQVDEASGLVLGDAVEAEAQHAARAAGLVERVAAGALGDDAAVQSRSEVVGPRTWRVGAGDYVFARFVVEVAVLHWTSSQLRATDYRSGEPPRNVSRPLDLLRLHVPRHDLVRRSVVDDAALVKPDGAVAEG